MSLDDAAERFRKHVEKLPDAIKARELLAKRPLPLYWAMGTDNPTDLAHQLVRDRLTASLEMAMGYLYEFVVVDACGARKLTNAEKKKWRGIDFRKESGADVYLINLKSARGTANSDISTATRQNLASAKRLEAAEMADREKSGDDNPLLLGKGRVHAVRAIARGPASSRTATYDGQTIEVLVGDNLWEALGAGGRFTRKIQQAIGAHPVDRAAFDAAEARAVERVVSELNNTGVVDASGLLVWQAVLDKYPDV
jgi:hypothetical protein